MLHRRHLATLAAGALSAPRTAGAQGTWPDRPIRIIVPYPPGGSNDTVARILQPKLQEILGKPIVIENRGGASGSVGAGEAARAAPDGATWLLANDTIATNDTLMQLPYRTMQNFSFCTVVGTCPYALLAHPGTPFRSLADVETAAKAAPATLNFATTGVGSLAHVSATLWQQRSGVSLVHVPYRGGGPALQDALAGHVPLFMSNIVIVMPHVRSGGLRALGVTSAKESRFLPGVKPFAELGYPGFEALTYWVLLGPAGVPAPILARMHAAIATAVLDPVVRVRLEEQGAEIGAGSPAAAEKFIKEEIEIWGKVIRDNDIRSES